MVMNIDKLREEIKHDEGCVYEIYLDHLGLPTFGIGHLITDADPEYNYNVGDKVSKERCEEVFNNDIKSVINDCELELLFFYDLPEEVQHIVANMMFNLGTPRFSKFIRFKAALANDNWNGAAIEMKDSKWYKQVTNRAERLIERMKNVD